MNNDDDDAAWAIREFPSLQQFLENETKGKEGKEQERAKKFHDLVRNEVLNYVDSKYELDESGQVLRQSGGAVIPVPAHNQQRQQHPRPNSSAVVIDGEDDDAPSLAPSVSGTPLGGNNAEKQLLLDIVLLDENTFLKEKLQEANAEKQLLLDENKFLLDENKFRKKKLQEFNDTLEGFRKEHQNQQKEHQKLQKERQKQQKELEDLKSSHEDLETVVHEELKTMVDAVAELWIG
jgi:hypothetical protein